jgi:4-amino-4-deoxy-L-arabinose transferase-like glycosyltransferase
VVVVLSLVTVLGYWRVGEAGFVNRDDEIYVEHQPRVNQGLHSGGFAWAFTASPSSDWHPLTTLSHLLDCEVFGVSAAPMHWENLLWHVINSTLVFLVLRALTGATWRPAIVAALFALHPLHVESVAWISERKSLLSTFFWLLGIWAYAGYARHQSRGRYVLVAAALGLALLSKPMAVTFPCILLLLDFWPLRRWPARGWRSLFIEKLPLFALVAIHGVITLMIQSASGAAVSARRFSLDERAGNAVVAYARYLGKAFWPESLSPMYFHPGYWPAGVVVGATLGLAAVSMVIWWLRRTRPWLIFGWLWFLATLLPVIGLVEMGAQSLADRYMYLPILGVFILMVWQTSRLVHLWPRARGALFAATASILIVFGLLTTRQVKIWRNSATLHEHGIAPAKGIAPSH